MFTYGIDEGHNAYPDTGAVGIIVEDAGTKAVGDLVIAKLKALGGIGAILCTPFGQRFSSVVGSLAKRCQIANSNSVNFYVAIHMNASNGEGHGVEVYAMSQAGRTVAQKVCDEIASLGFSHRGVKDGSHLFVVRNTNAIAILVEMCFCDSREDMNIYNPERIANAIVKGLTGISSSAIPAPSPVAKPANYSHNFTLMNIQKSLNAMGFRDMYGCKLVEDGISGERTISAVKSFQKVMGLAVDGVAGANTLGALNQIMSKPLDSASAPHLEYATRLIQWRVGAGVDGVFGNGTANAVKAWQRAHGLTADGVVGANSWKELIG